MHLRVQNVSLPKHINYLLVFSPRNLVVYVWPHCSIFSCLPTSFSFLVRTRKAAKLEVASEITTLPDMEGHHSVARHLVHVRAWKKWGKRSSSVDALSMLKVSVQITSLMQLLNMSNFSCTVTGENHL
jgi:hypothetical protein